MPSYPSAEISVSEVLPEVNVEDVSSHTDGIVRSYINFRLLNNHELGESDFGANEGDEDQFGSDMQNGRRLAMVAEQFEQFSLSELEQLVQRVAMLTGPNASDDDWFTAFRIVIDGVLVGEFSWTKLVLVLSFGYRLLQKAFQNGWRPALGLVSGIIVRYLLQENVLRWIARHGGWIATRCLTVTRNMDLQTNIAISIGTGLAACLLSFSFVYLVRRRALGPP